MNNTKLLPCPFCGGTPSHWEEPGFNMVQCLGCFAEVSGDKNSCSIQSWNTRVVAGHAVQWQDDDHTYSHEVIADNGEEVAGTLKADDAKLIAAAPDMYRLIRKCYKVLHMGVWEVDETDQEVCEKINDVMWNHFGDAWRPKADEVV